MALLSANPTPDHEGRGRGRSEDSLLLALREREKPVWVDLRSPDRTQLEEVRQVLAFPPEVVTHCLLPTHTLKVIPIDSALFLVTFLGACTPQSLCVLRALKIYIAPGFVLTVHSRSSTELGLRRLRLPGLPSANTHHTGHLLRLILEGTVQSYEAIGEELRRCLRGATPTDPRQSRIEPSLRQEGRRKGQQFTRFLRQQRVFLQEVARAGGTLFEEDDRSRLLWLAERAGVLARRVREFVRSPQERGGLKKKALKVILTETEKQTILLGGRFAFRRFIGVDLAGAIFRQANLEGAKFVRSDLHGADFRQANLQGAVFSFCDLHRADFTDACLEGTSFRTSFGLSPAMQGYIRSHGGVV
jgi:pentapeptide repeat protein/CorA-like Mg2+ transporter protein